MVLEDNISIGYEVMASVANEFRDKLPPGVDLDDLISLGGEELLKANAKFDPNGDMKWKGFVATWMRFRFKNLIAAARKRANRQQPLEVEMASGDTAPREDTRAADPAVLAGRREEGSRRRKALSVAKVKAATPPPDEVAVKARSLQMAMFDAVQVQDITAVIDSLKAKAIGGDMKAVRLLFDLIQPPPPAPAPAAQTTVVVVPSHPFADD